MARMSKISYTKRIAYNVGNYESVTVEVGGEVVVDPEDDVEKVRRRLVKTIDAWHEEEAQRSLDEHEESKNG